MINIVIPMAGLGSRFVAAGYLKPKPFIDVCGKPMIERVMDNLNCEGANFILIARQEHLENEFLLVEKIKMKFNATFIGIDKLTEGTACTVLFAKKLIDNSHPLLIANSDQIVDLNIQEYIDDCIRDNADGSILTFFDRTRNPKWSFAKVNDKNIVLEVREKKPISDIATVGIYLFTKGSLFVESAIEMIVNNDRINNEFYTCPVYNYSIKYKKIIKIFNINFESMHGLGTPEDLEKYLENKKNES
jgi:dTDP-glucose pyrophosphorylase